MKWGKHSRLERFDFEIDWSVGNNRRKTLRYVLGNVFDYDSEIWNVTQRKNKYIIE